MNFNNLNPVHKIREYSSYGLNLWQCPQFLFPVMGAIIIISIIATYFIGQYFVQEPEVVALIILGITAVLLIVGHIIISSFEIVASASKAKSEFVSIMSHQLRTPLSIIKWQLNLFAENKIKPENKETMQFFAYLEEENQKMIHIINDLLELNRIEDNTLILNPAPFSFKEVVENLAERRNKSLSISNSNLSVEA